MNNLVLITVIVIVAAVLVSYFYVHQSQKVTVLAITAVRPGNLSFSVSGCPALVYGEVYSVISTLSSTGFGIYNVSGYKDYVVSPSDSGSITLNVTRKIVGGNSTRYTNLSHMNITDTNGFGFYSATNQTIAKNGYDTLLPYTNITNVTGRYCVNGFAGACIANAPIITGFAGLIPTQAPIQASCGKNKFNISIENVLGENVNINNASAYLYLTENNGSIIRSNLSLLPVQNGTLLIGESKLFSFAGNACASNVGNYSFYAAINYSLAGRNTTYNIASGEVKGRSQASIPKNGFESELTIPALSSFRQMPISVNFSGDIPSNISEFLSYENGFLNISALRVSNHSGVINATFSMGLPVYILHPGITTSVNPRWRSLSADQSGTFDTTFNVASSAIPGTYWIYPEVSGQFPCSYQYYALLTIGDAPYNGSLSITQFS